MLGWNSFEHVHVLEQPNLPCFVELPLFLASQFVLLVPHDEVVKRMNPGLLAGLFFNHKLRLFRILFLLRDLLDPLPLAINSRLFRHLLN